VWHGRQTTRGLKEMVRSYETFAADTRRTMLLLTSAYRTFRKMPSSFVTCHPKCDSGPKPARLVPLSRFRNPPATVFGPQSTLERCCCTGSTLSAEISSLMIAFLNCVQSYPGQVQHSIGRARLHVSRDWNKQRPVFGGDLDRFPLAASPG